MNDDDDLDLRLHEMLDARAADIDSDMSGPALRALATQRPGAVRRAAPVLAVAAAVAAIAVGAAVLAGRGSAPAPRHLPAGGVSGSAHHDAPPQSAPPSSNPRSPAPSSAPTPTGPATSLDPVVPSARTSPAGLPPVPVNSPVSIVSPPHAPRASNTTADAGLRSVPPRSPTTAASR